VSLSRKYFVCHCLFVKVYLFVNVYHPRNQLIDLCLCSRLAFFFWGMATGALHQEAGGRTVSVLTTILWLLVVPLEIGAYARLSTKSATGTVSEGPWNAMRAECNAMAFWRREELESSGFSAQEDASLVFSRLPQKHRTALQELETKIPEAVGLVFFLGYLKHHDWNSEAGALYGGKWRETPRAIDNFSPYMLYPPGYDGPDGCVVCLEDMKGDGEGDHCCAPTDNIGMVWGSEMMMMQRQVEYALSRAMNYVNQDACPCIGSLPGVGDKPRHGSRPTFRFPARMPRLCLRGGGGDKTRLAVRKAKGPACTPRKNKPQRKSRLKESVVARTNRKITTQIIRRGMLRSNLRLEATGERQGMKLVSTNSASDKRLNLPSPQPGERYLQRLKSIASGRRVVKGGSLGKSRRK
jgi:hypothetical protein